MVRTQLFKLHDAAFKGPFDLLYENGTVTDIRNFFDRLLALIIYAALAAVSKRNRSVSVPKRPTNWTLSGKGLKRAVNGRCKWWKLGAYQERSQFQQVIHTVKTYFPRA